MSHALLPFAKRMRSAPTDAEACLWLHLRAGRFRGFKFKRQQPIGTYIVDFVCFDRRLVIEVDGGQHIAHAVRDAARTAWLESRGFIVVRFWNDAVLKEANDVLEEILMRLEAQSRRATPLPALRATLSRKGRGRSGPA